jgi:hypothetical protein
MNYYTNPENEIRAALIKFTNEWQIHCSTTMIDDFMKKTHEKRRLSLNKDEYVNVCSYLHPKDILMLTTLCKEYMTHYKYIWGIIQRYYFPYSIIPTKNYLEIRNNFAIDKWLYRLDYLQLNVEDGYKPWSDIMNYDNIIYKRSNDLKNLSESGHMYQYTKITHLSEIRSLKNDRNDDFKFCTVEVQNLINDFKFLSYNDYTKAPYYINNKPELDMRIYGLNPSNQDDIKKWEEGLKWIKGEYDDYCEFDYDIMEAPNYNIYEYNTNGEGIEYRCRVRPEWMIFEKK